MNNQEPKINIGDTVKVKGKLYLVFDIKINRIFCRQFRFTKKGRFQYYQDYNFPLNICQLANLKEKQIIYEERKQASIQRKPFSPIATKYINHLIR
ncbi:MAG: hypothetical protein GW795_05650 [Cyanobacteria bacterium]|nr:hypothetical protein [Cyanobacteria bacterium CG_2015-16_32_12]NCO78820.1 hypothetical protein [Cyanobacteria bacterium CG_2015-22_32_23]NCQ05201.1 hypothetical protein [Cyanobacteria bacterium CG_2015-09_32_10]NCQ41372.1 hypothetical protein [Cyanobacteria bacterium CG_2015-04_32_10]NCS85105.1 hypothetical protein [Cyanobacteria bacterium CG_2015-02_32_10]